MIVAIHNPLAQRAVFTIQRWVVPVLLVVAGSVFTPGASALEPVYQSGGSEKLAIGGYDPVAYFRNNRPVEGRGAFEVTWNGATWRFASAENRDRFQADPEAYAPQYGGYCAYAVSNNYTAPTDPAAFKIVDGKLYLNFSPFIQTKWEQDIPGRIRRAEENWPALLAR